MADASRIQDDARIVGVSSAVEAGSNGINDRETFVQTVPTICNLFFDTTTHYWTPECLRCLRDINGAVGLGWDDNRQGVVVFQQRDSNGIDPVQLAEILLPVRFLPKVSLVKTMALTRTLCEEHEQCIRRKPWLAVSKWVDAVETCLGLGRGGIGSWLATHCDCNTSYAADRLVVSSNDTHRAANAVLHATHILSQF